MNVIDYNSRAWDAQVESGENQWTVPVSRETIAQARNGDFSVLLTPNIPVPRDWFPDEMNGAEILCLASAGGQQAPVFAAAGARVTSFDNSPAQLRQDDFVARRDGLEIRLERGDAADLSRFPAESFDLVFHACSNCFMPDVRPVWKEAFRVLRPGGVMLAGFHNSFLYVFDRFLDEDEGRLAVRHRLPYSDERDLTAEERQRLFDRNEPLEFGHTLDDQIGGQIDAGFLIGGFFEDGFNDEATALNRHCPIFIATRAIKP